MNRRRFTLTAIPAAILTGCHSPAKPSRDATLFHNSDVRAAVSELDQAMNVLEMRVSSFNAENWQDALSNMQTSIIRMRSDIDELKKALGYGDVASSADGGPPSDAR